MRRLSINYLSLALGLCFILPVYATPTITDVTAQQRYPWNGKVDISYTVSGDIAAAAKAQAAIPSLKVTATDRDAGTTYAASSLSGDTGLADGTHNLVWDMTADGLTLKSTNVVFSVSCETTPATYCVIDLSAGANASSYPITYLAAPPSGGFNVDPYKTTKLVLKRIEAGSFQMGDNKVNVKLTKPFFLGIFEMTQKQYVLVAGNNPSHFSGDKLPVEKVTYNAIRGSSNGENWPTSNTVDSSSFLGKLRERTNLDFDLPTEAQWEYACRAGTTTTYSYGNSANGNYMWTRSNASSPNEVGRKSPNNWGLYDMHGNVWEWCLDRHSSPLAGGTDPKGASSGTVRVVRGGSWYRDTSYSTSSYRTYHALSYSWPDNDGGFRLSWTLNATVGTAICASSSEATMIGSPDVPVIAPSGGIVVTWPQFVTISCATEGATIHYTTDGTEPSENSPEYRRFRVSERTTVKAVAIWNGLHSEVAIAEFAAGLCADPVITPGNDTIFEHSGQTVSISWSGEDGVLRYTTDGSDPTAESPIYGGPFSIDESTVVKAKAFGDQFFDSAVVTASLTRVWVNVATPVVTAASSFTGSKTQVSLSCATEGATIRYTLNGNAPNSHSTRYTGLFYVTNSCTVKTYATCADYLDSEVSTFVIEKVWCIGDTMGVPDQAFSTGGDVPFFRVADATAPLGESMQSGAITHNQTSTMTTMVFGPGTVSFQWRTSCEKDDMNLYEWDHAEFEVDAVVVARLDGETTWQTISQTFADDGAHTLVWRYIKDDVESVGDDCCRVADFLWTATAPVCTETQTTPEPVPYAWLDDFLLGDGTEDGYETAAWAVAANGVNQVWECYVTGVSPTNSSERFLARIDMTNGTSRVWWSPDLNEGGTKHERVYTVIGKTNLTDKAWGPTNEATRFFRVKVSMPE